MDGIDMCLNRRMCRNGHPFMATKDIGFTIKTNIMSQDHLAYASMRNTSRSSSAAPYQKGTIRFYHLGICDESGTKSYTLFVAELICRNDADSNLDVILVFPLTI